jgi:hypothetical protein
MITKLKENIRERVSNLYGGYFALVMAIGIVSIASYFMGMVSLA